MFVDEDAVLGLGEEKDVRGESVERREGGKSQRKQAHLVSSCKLGNLDAENSGGGGKPRWRGGEGSDLDPDAL